MNVLPREQQTQMDEVGPFSSTQAIQLEFFLQISQIAQLDGQLVDCTSKDGEVLLITVSSTQTQPHTLGTLT
jgi:hypothetical protein